MNNKLDHDAKRQAESFYRVMVFKQFTPQQISDTLSRMGELFVEHAKTIVAEKD